MEAIALWDRWKVLGALPNGQGLIGERETVIQILMLLSCEQSRMEQAEMEERNSSRKR